MGGNTQCPFCVIRVGENLLYVFRLLMDKDMRRLRIFSVLLFCTVASFAQINTKRMMDIGRNAIFFEDYVLSIQYFNKIINVKPYWADPYFYRGVAKMSLEDYVGAEADCSAALERNPFMVDAYRCRGAARACLKQYDEALADFDKGLEFEPKNKYLMLCKGSVYAGEERWDTAIAVFSEMLKAYPNYKDAYLRRGYCYFSNGDTANALADFEKVLSIDRFSPDGHAACGYVLNGRKEHDKALAEMNEAIRLDPYCVNYYVNRGVILTDAGDTLGAMSDYDYAIQLNPTCTPAFFNRAILRTEQGQKRLALEDYDEVLDLDPENHFAVYNRALLKKELGQYRSAMKDISVIIKEYPKFYPAYFVRSELKRKLNDKRGADADYVKALSVKQQGEKEAQSQSPEKASLPKSKKKSKDMGNHNNMVVMDKQEEMQRLSYRSESRGRVQNVNFHVELGAIVKLTAHPKAGMSMGKHTLFDKRISVFNGKKIYPEQLSLSCEERQIDNEELQRCFSRIEKATRQLVTDSSPKTYFSRSLDYLFVSDYESAMEDLTQAIEGNDAENAWLYYFCRANVRYLKYLSDVELVSKGETALPEGMDLSMVGQVACDLVQKDYDKVKELMPDFSPAWYNSGHVYVRQQNYQSALDNFSKAITLTPSFAQAYFNRGLTHIYLKKREEGISDLSKAGELGLYSAYNVIKRFGGGR